MTPGRRTKILHATQCGLKKREGAESLEASSVCTAVEFQALRGDLRALGGVGGLSELPWLLCNSPSILHLHTVYSFDLDAYLKGTGDICLSNNHLKGKTSSVEPWTLPPYF